MNLKLGLKLWSKNKNYTNEAVKLFKDSIYDYIELYTVPGSYKKYINIWSDLKIPFIIHAPYFKHRLNLAKKEYGKKNLQLIKEAQQFADKLNTDKIIVHPGIGGDIKETSRQIKIISDSRIIIENMPYFALVQGLICNGAVIDEIKYILTHNKIGFCLDIGHAICSANAQKIKPEDYLKKLIQLRPIMYHLTDGDHAGKYDRHDHLGKGNFPLKDILNMLPANAQVTIETKKDSIEDLNDFVKDVAILKKLSNSNKIYLRRVNKKDCYDLWKWRNHPQVRKWCLNSQKVKLGDHEKWFENKIRDKRVRIYIAENQKGEKIGQVRLEKNKKRSTYININLNPQFFRKGYGSKIIKEATGLFLKENSKIKEMLAEIFDQNIISQKAFRKAGYVFSDNFFKYKQKIVVFKFKGK